MPSIRSEVIYSATAVASGTTGTETAITLTRSSDLTATTTGTSFVFPSGKSFRITGIVLASRGHNTATAQVTTFNLRVNTGGAVTTTSTPILLKFRTMTGATANAVDRVVLNFNEPLQLVGDGTAQFGITANAVFTTNAPTWDVLITGYEY